MKMDEITDVEKEMLIARFAEKTRLAAKFYNSFPADASFAILEFAKAGMDKAVILEDECRAKLGLVM